MVATKFKELTKQALKAALQKIDEDLTTKKEKPLKIVLLGAASILMLDIRTRGTTDIDIAAVFDAQRFRKKAEKLGFRVDIVSVSTTVDFSETDTREVFRGKTLCALSVNEQDLLKLKLERFRKHDPDDIAAIIKKFNIDYVTFKNIALEAARDFVGEPKRFSLQILAAAERHYSEEQVQDLEKSATNLLKKSLM